MSMKVRRRLALVLNKSCIIVGGTGACSFCNEEILDARSWCKCDQCAVLGRFLHSLNKFCEEEYGLLFDIPDYSVYEFAKV